MLILVVLAFVIVLVAGSAVGFTAWTAWRAERLVPPCGRLVTIGGVKLHVLEIGEGPAIVMVHGLAAQLQTFTYKLSGLLSGYRLVLIDRPGCGYSQAAPRATLEAQAAIIAALIHELDLGPALVVGHSLGGAVALALAVDHPDVVAGLALLAPASRPEDNVPVALRALAIRSELVRWIVGWSLAVPVGRWRRRATLRMLFGPGTAPPDFAVRGGAALSARPVTFRNACRDLVEAGSDLARCTARYREIKVPVGVLFGTGDLILDPQWHGRGLRGLVHDLHIETTNAGHMLPISDPVSSARFIERMAGRAGLHERAGAA